MPKESSSDKRHMNLSTGQEVDTGESTMNCKTQRRKMDLSQVHVYVQSAVDSRNWTSINNWQVQLSSQHAVDTAFHCSSVDEGMDSSHPRNGL